MTSPPVGAATEGIAVVGLSARLPGAPDVRAYWRNLRDGVESITSFDEEELRAAGVHAALLADPAYVRAAGVLDGVEDFDAAFFGYNPREAQLLDPQQRLFLEGAWSALEHAGYGASDVRGTTGVYASASLGRYLLANLLPGGDLDDLTTLVGNDKDFVAARVAYHLGLTGPAVMVQSGCSSSLVAVALACQALAGHQCDMALAGGVALRLPQTRGYLHVAESILSPDGHCRPFDARAQGTVFGSGLGVVVLKRLADALADGDTVHAVVLGTAVNNDGDLKLGFSAPSVDRQAAAVALAQAVAGVDARSVSYVEGHGTATALGDPVEVAALTQAFRIGGARRGSCALGSVKGNVGHLDVAAGIAGFVKAVLALEHGQIPPTLHFERPAPALDLENGPFYVNATLRPWRTDGGPRRAGVSSFGLGGTNAHVVLEQAPAPAPTTPSRPHQLLVLSAKTPAALDTAARDLHAHLSRHPDLSLPDAAHTLQVGRRAFERRRALVCRDVEEACQKLAGGGAILEGHPGSARPRVAFLFPGQGAQHVDMGHALYATEPVFREHVDGCSELLRPHLGLDLRDLLYPRDADAPAAAERLARTSSAQPALFVIEYALARLWMEWGVRPDALLGHSVGELVAACLTQVFRLEHALEIVATRGRLMQALPPGAMTAVPLAPPALEARLQADLALAAVNAPGLCTVSGPTDAVARFEARLAEEGVTCRRLAVSHAFHSPMMDPVLEAFTECVRRVPRKPPEKPFLSNVTGTWITAAQALDPAYWAQQLRATVRFADNLAPLLAESGRVLLEVGPGRTLSTLAKEQGRASVGATIVASMRHPHDDTPDVQVLLAALGRLWTAGVPVDWRGFAQHERRRRVPLPTYPFERARHWIEPDATAPAPNGRRADPAHWFYLPSWKRAAGAEPAPRDGPTRWIVVGRWDAFVRRLETRGDEVLILEADAEASQLVEALGGERPSRIVHLGLAAPEELDAAAALALGHESLVRLVDGLHAHGRQAVRLAVVTHRAHDVTGETHFPERATVAGACRVLPQEFPALRLRAIDLDAGAEDAALLLEEELARPDGEPLVALRGRHRWIPDVQAVALPRPDQVACLRRGGVYLITGGLGGIGLTLADFLAEHYGARLVLCGRRPPRDPAAIRRLEQQGGEVLVLQADVTNREDMRRALAATHARFGPLDGVIHAAGVAADVLARDDAPLRAKIDGTSVLAELCGDEPGLVVLCSAISTVLGGIGQAAYGAGNHYLDAFAAARRGQRPRVVSIGWDTWRQVGMAANAQVPAALRERKQQVLRDGLSCAEGVDVFRRILASPHAHVLVSTTPLAGRLAELPARAEAAREEPAPAAITVSAPAPPADDIEATVLRIWTQLLGLERASPADSFFEQGGNSLLATQMLARLRERFANAELSLAGLFAEPTVAGVIASIRKTHGTPPAPVDDGRPLQEQLRQVQGDARRRLLVDYLGREVAQLTGAAGRFEDLDPALLAAHLTWAVRRDLDLPLYPPEIRARPSLEALAQLVDEELLRAAPSASAAFVLSSPRSGSTLLRLMLSAHSQLFCPPELFLLDHAGLRAWSEDPFAPFYRDGLVRALMGRRGLEFDAALALVHELVARDAPAAEVYRMLQEPGGRLLVDKTPTYALDAGALRRAETLFDAPRYIGLVRHPYAVIESFVRNRLDRIRREEGEPHEVAERVWSRANRNLLDFGEEIGPERFRLVRYERLVAEPEATLRELCAFLGVAFEPAVLDPYGHGRMFGGPGDPELHRRGALDPRLGEAWRGVRLPRPLDGEARRLAASLGYELP